MSSNDFESQDPELLYPAPSTGCCSAYALPPIVILVMAAAAVALAFRNPASFPSPPNSSVAAAGNPTDSRISTLFTPEVQYWGGAITRWAANACVDPNLVAVVMQIESCGDPRARSRAGAAGLFQVMPYHFAATDEPYAPDTNAARGLAYLTRALTAAGGDARLALAGYNGGIGVISRAEWTWPAETARYAYWGSGIYADATSGSVSSVRLDEWLAAGGYSLCRIARQNLHLDP